MEIRLLTRGELDQSLDLVWKVFCEYEAVNYTEDSRQVFYDAIHSKDYLDMLTSLRYTRQYMHAKYIKNWDLIRPVRKRKMAE